MNELDEHDRLILMAMLDGKTIFTLSPYKIRSYAVALRYLADGMGSYLHIEDKNEDIQAI